MNSLWPLLSCFYEAHNPCLANKRGLVNVREKSGGTDGQKINEMATRPRQFIFNKRRACFYLQSRKKGQYSPANVKRLVVLVRSKKFAKHFTRRYNAKKSRERGSKNRVIGKIYCSEIVSMTYCVLFFCHA